MQLKVDNAGGPASLGEVLWRFLEEVEVVVAAHPCSAMEHSGLDRQS